MAARRTSQTHNAQVSLTCSDRLGSDQRAPWVVAWWNSLVGGSGGWLAGNGVARSRLLGLMREMEGAIALSRSWGSRYRRGSPRERARATGSEAWIRCLG
ncbi:hypothetical protein IG631_06406 [Alternaria alternata]|nr:hypothetical protein IG631_06406 [Alternaria alternata]